MAPFSYWEHWQLSACCQVRTLGITASQSELRLHFGSLGSMLELERGVEESEVTPDCHTGSKGAEKLKNIDYAILVNPREKIHNGSLKWGF